MHLANSGPDADRVELRLLLLAGLFVLADAAALTISPAARLRTWTADLRLDHWLGVGIWLAAFFSAHRIAHRLPKRDPFLLPIAALLTGWGLLAIWRLLPAYGLRQALWLGLSMFIFVLGLRLPGTLAFLRRYKYLWMSASLLLGAATLVMGVNPMGYGPEMWLGCCGVYLQPSEPLKLMIVVYMAAFLADRQPYLMLATARRGSILPWLAALLPLLAPTLIVAGLALAVLIVQRDLGAAAIFVVLYTVQVYVAFGRRRIPIVGAAGILLAGGLGYFLYDVVRVRVDGWLYPWADPSGRSYQIIQSLIAVANGGVAGRGPGMGSPGLAPLAHSDLIFAAIAEEQGLVGVLGLCGVLALLAWRGLWAALQAGDHFRRYLAAGLTAMLVGQSLLIIGGSLRLLPLTGVTLPFVSYGGSSLLTSIVALLLIVRVSNRAEPAPARLYLPQAHLHLGAWLGIGLALAALAAGWWGLVRASDLLARTDNQRRYIADRFVRRGSLLDRHDSPITQTEGEPGVYERRVLYPDLSSVVGYTDPTYGQAGLEAGLDARLRGLEGNPQTQVLIDRLLYGQTPPGLDVRLSLDLKLQTRADTLLKGHVGALALIDARNGQILALASSPTFDANRLSEQWEELTADPTAPLLNRAALGQYPMGELLKRLQLDGTGSLDLLRDLPLPPGLDVQYGPGISLPAIDVSRLQAGNQDLQASNVVAGVGTGISPLQMSLLSATISAGGILPSPQIALAGELSTGGWELLPAAGASQTLIDRQVALELAQENANGDLWEMIETVAPTTDDAATWYIGGQGPGLTATPYALALILEEQNPGLARQIGREILMTAQAADLTFEPAPLLQQLIRFDTTNPPGNEAECIRWIKGLMDRAGVANQVLGLNDDRTNLVARLPGQGKSPPLLMYGHVDVVTTSGQSWSVPPFEGRVMDGFMWGRGALDMKGPLSLFLSAFLKAAVSGTELTGDLIFAAVADEEVGGEYGARYLVERHPDLFAGVRYAFGEFGGFNLSMMGRRLYPIMVAEKQGCWMKATFHGQGGHGSMPVKDGAMAKAARVIQTLNRRQPPIHISPAVRLMLDAISHSLPAPANWAIGGLHYPALAAILLPLLGDRGDILSPLLRNTISPTMIAGSDKINVIPGEVQLGLDGRMIPGWTQEQMIAEMRALLGDDFDLEVMQSDPGPGEPDMGLFDRLGAVLRQLDPEAHPVPYVMPGVTDARFFTRLGIQTYGFTPLRLPDDFIFLRTIHSADERVPVDALDFGVSAITQALQVY